MTRLAETPPVACSSCGGQYTDRQHVDFEAAWDGPVYNEGVAQGDGESPHRHIAVAIDDLVICDQCLTEGAGLIGLVPGGEQALELSETLAQVDNLRDRLAERNNYIAQLEQTVAAKPQQPKSRSRAKATA